MISCRFCKVLWVLCLIPTISPTDLCAQTTYYYEQVKVVKGNETVSIGEGGQFISFYKDICYDSDNKGRTVNNGTLDLISQSGDKYVKYKGQSYWGNVTYQFTTTMDKLAVIKSDKTVYVYQRVVAPNGVTTSSLIKSRTSHNNLSMQTYSPQTYYGGNNNSNTINSHSETPQKTSVNYNQKSRHKCYHCNGTGEKIIDPSRNVPKFGLDDDTKEYCSKCGQYFKKGTHEHIPCSYCGAKGYEEY